MTRFISDAPGIVGFGWKAFEALEQKHLTDQLVVLNIGPMSEFVGSGMILKVLHSCTGLKEIRACQMLGREICERAQAEGKWICRGLEVFNMEVVFKLPDNQLVQTQEGVFRQLSGLTRLRILNVGPRSTNPSEQQRYSLFSTGPEAEAKVEAEVSLLFQLEYGLAQLAGLVRLETLVVGGGVSQRLSKEDVEWMRRWWIGLQFAVGVMP